MGTSDSRRDPFVESAPHADEVNCNAELGRQGPIVGAVHLLGKLELVAVLVVELSTEGRVPRGEVDAAVDEVFSRFAVDRLYADPQDWLSEIGDWSLKYGEEHVVEWPTNSIRRMHAALGRFEVDLSTGRITHDGCPLTAMAAAKAKKVAKPGQKYVIGKPTDHQKIDPIMAGVLAHEASMDAHTKGWDVRVEAKALVFGRRRR
ncbi:MAG: terminase [Corynebacterium sp.]|uniref:terminase n=1 Tax=Corynebacterium sp. TaxID=1720 RepID=UPI0026E03248|nr:terminase [Corynebacterium sp.]MDO5670843.1 terminase [Corynebacterium sp.]